MTIKLSYNVKEAAEATGLSQDTVKRAIRSGDLKAQKSGKDKGGEPVGKYVIQVHHLKDWLDGMAAA